MSECFFCITPEEEQGDITECSKCDSIKHCEKHEKIHMPTPEMCLPFKGKIFVELIRDFYR